MSRAAVVNQGSQMIIWTQNFAAVLRRMVVSGTVGRCARWCGVACCIWSVARHVAICFTLQFLHTVRRPAHQDAAPHPVCWRAASVPPPPGSPPRPRRGATTATAPYSDSVTHAPLGRDLNRDSSKNSQNPKLFPGQHPLRPVGRAGAGGCDGAGEGGDGRRGRASVMPSRRGALNRKRAV